VSAQPRGVRRSLGLNAYLTAFTNARLVKLYIPRSRDVEKGGGPRGSCDGIFSSGSRARLMERFHRIRQDAFAPVFLTFTFPDFFPEPKWAKRSLDAMFKRWKRKRPEWSAIWRMELKERRSGENAGSVAPHFHLLLFNVERQGHDQHVIARLVEAMRYEWAEVCERVAETRRGWCAFPRREYDCYAHVEHGTNGAGTEDWKSAAAYCSAYCSKKGSKRDEEGLRGAGRVWGVHNRNQLPEDRAPVREYLPRPALWRARRAFRAFVKSRSGKKTGTAKLFTDGPKLWRELVLRERERAEDEISHELAEIWRREQERNWRLQLPEPVVIVRTHGQETKTDQSEHADILESDWRSCAGERCGD